MSIRFLALAAILLLPGCSGILAYENNGSVAVGALDDDDINVMNASYGLTSIGGDDDLVYAVDSAGEDVGVCRTDYDDREMRLAIYNKATRTDDGRAVWGRKLNVGQTRLAAGIDQALAPDDFDYVDLMDADSLDLYFHCFAMGAGSADGELVIYIQPKSKAESLAQNIAVLVDVGQGSLQVTDAELWNRTGSPQRIVAQENPLRGNTVSIQNGDIHINGAPVRHNGSAVDADSVKHQFE